MRISKEYGKKQWKEKRYQEYKRRKDFYISTKEGNNKQHEHRD